jgi:hypothetical protein
MTTTETITEAAEITMLREFYQSWEAMHGTPNDRLHRKRKEVCAQLLVNNAHTLRRFYEGVKVPVQVEEAANA